jgi:hypothetical protein
MRTDDGMLDEPALLAAPCFTMCEVTSSDAISCFSPHGRILA